MHAQAHLTADRTRVEAKTPIYWRVGRNERTLPFTMRTQGTGALMEAKAEAAVDPRSRGELVEVCCIVKNDDAVWIIFLQSPTTLFKKDREAAEKPAAAWQLTRQTGA